MRIETEHGQVVFSRPGGEQLLRHFTARWPMPVVSLETDGDRGAAYGVVFQVGEDEAWCFLHTLPPEVGSEIEVVLALLQKGMSEALARLTEWRPPGVLLPCACLIDSGDGSMTPGMAVFTSDALGPDDGGPTYSELVSAFVDLLSTTSAGVMLPPFTAVRRVPRLAAGAIKFDTALVDGAALCFRVEPEDPLDEEEQRELAGIWAHAGVKHIAWAPAIPIFLSDEEAAMLRAADEPPDAQPPAADDGFADSIDHVDEPDTTNEEVESSAELLPALEATPAGQPDPDRSDAPDRDVDAAVEPAAGGPSAAKRISMQTPSMAPVESGAHKHGGGAAGLSAAWGPTHLDFTEQARTTADRDTLIRLRGETLSADEEEARRAAAAAIAMADSAPAAHAVIAPQLSEDAPSNHHVAVVEDGDVDDLAGFETLDASTAGDLIGLQRGSFESLDAGSDAHRLIPALSSTAEDEQEEAAQQSGKPSDGDLKKGDTKKGDSSKSDSRKGDPKRSDFDNTLVGSGVQQRDEDEAWDAPTADAFGPTTTTPSGVATTRGNTDGYKPFDASSASAAIEGIDAQRSSVSTIGAPTADGPDRFAAISTGTWADVHDFAGDRAHAGAVCSALRVLLRAGQWPEWLPAADEIRRAGPAIALFNRDRLEALLELRVARGVDAVELARLQQAQQPRQAIVFGVDRLNSDAVPQGWASRPLDDLASLVDRAAQIRPEDGAIGSFGAFLAELTACRDLFRHDALADARPWEDALRRSCLRSVLLQTLHRDVLGRVVPELRSHGWTDLDPVAVAAGNAPTVRSFTGRVSVRGGHVATEITIVDPDSPHCYGVRAAGGRVLIFAEAFDRASTGIEATLAWGRRNEFLRDLCAVLQIDTTHIEGQATDPTRAVEIDALGVLRADDRQTLAQTLIETSWVLWRRTHKGRFARR